MIEKDIQNRVLIDEEVRNDLIYAFFSPLHIRSFLSDCC